MNNTWIGKSVGGRYHIEELLGQGGMSAVYKASDPNLKRVVAVKMIHAHLSSDAGFVARFEEEATAVAKLRHPNIVQVYDYDHDEQVYYMVLEFVPGETLQEHLKRLNESDRKLPIKDALKYARDISNAADYAHHRGMIHRDIKPANVMLSVQGDAILMDFGIAKIIGGQRHTATGAVVGTAMYMSPEQIKGEQPDRRTDIYSLGVMLYEMVSGHPPYESDSAMTLMMMHVNDPIPDVRQLNPEVPADLVAVINKALAKNPGERYQTAAELSTDLKKVQDRIAAGAEADTLKPGATRVEDLAGAQAVDATRIEPQTPQNEPGRTYVEQTPPVPPQGTAVERPTEGPRTSVERPAQTGSATSTGAIAPPQQKKSGLPIPLLAGAGVVIIGLICLIGGGIYAYNQFFGGTISPEATATQEQVAVIPSTTEAPTEEATLTPTITETSPPTATPTITLTPTPTVPVGIPFARINDITIDDQNRYVVDYETFEFTESLPNAMHVHFFFNTVPPEQAGNPGSGPWILYGGPRPFTEYSVSQRPQAATQMCILVANPDHSVQANSGNCYDLPEP